jgi:divalent metal cation (Fe/Co/Zn/Cd) transporter
VAVESVQRLIAGGATPAFSVVPFVVLAVEMAVNGWRAFVLRRTARETGSQALEADSLHFASDMYGSVAVIAGLALAAFGYSWGDPLAALAVALLVAWLGLRMGRRTVAALMDTAPSGVSERLAGLLANIAGVVRVERVRVRQVGPRHFVDASVAVPRTLPLDRLGAIKAKIQEAVAGMLDDADVTVSTTPVALDDETVSERVLVIARNRALAVHHVTVHALPEKLSVSADLELNGNLSIAAAHEVASGFESAVRNELGPGVEVESHIEPLQVARLTGRDAPRERVEAVRVALTELAGEAGSLRNVHDVRVRETPEGEIVNFHCHVDPRLTVSEVHEAVDALERALRRRFPSIKRVIGHAEPRPAETPRTRSPQPLVGTR